MTPRPLMIGLGLIFAAPLAAQMTMHVPEGVLPAPYDDAEAVARGAALHGDFCAACHGADLEGEENWRERDEDGLRRAPPHSAAGHMWHHTDMQNFMVVKYGAAALAGDGAPSNMPGFEGVLSDQEIADILAFIKSTWPQEVIAAHDEANASGHGH